jgi:TRAP-type C4-dicarboxylate transport system permease large subunit
MIARFLLVSYLTGLLIAIGFMLGSFWQSRQRKLKDIEPLALNEALLLPVACLFVGAFWPVIVLTAIHVSLIEKWKKNGNA